MSKQPLTAATTATAVRSGVMTAAEVVRDALAAIDRLDPVLHFMRERWDEAASAFANRLDAAHLSERGLLAGVPFLVKSGTSIGAPIVARLIEAGAIPIGTTTRPDATAISQAWGWNGTDHTRNPWNTERSSGGSSAGSAAAVAAGVVPFATGGDSAGSLRIPAAFCGVVGFKGTYGRIPRAAGRSRTQLTVAGIIGADLSDVVLATSVASGPHPADPTALPHWPVPASNPVQRLRVAYSSGLGFAVPDRAVDDLVRRRVIELAEAGAIELVDVAVELADPVGGWPALSDVERGRAVEHEVLQKAYELRRHNDAVLAEVFATINVLVTPTTPRTAYAYDDYETNVPIGDLCWAVNLSGHPAVTVPVGRLEGLPVGLQAIAGPHRDDHAVWFAGLARRDLPRPPVHVS